MLNDFKVDIDRYVYMGIGSWLYAVLTKQGLWALAEYRFSRWVLTRVHIPVARKLLLLFGFLWHKLIEITTGIDLPKHAEIGKGLFIPHFGGIIINPDVKIGEYCNLMQDVTIGMGGRGDKQGCPTIGHRVMVGAGARVIGRITIGNDVVIGANAVVTKDLPDGAVAVGVPAMIISYEGSQDYVSFRPRLRNLSQTE